MATTRPINEKTDRRVIKTRKAIMAAFDKLISQGDIAKITVSAIAREADIDRKTFYLHYSSVDDLAQQKAEEGIEYILEILGEQEPGATDAERLHRLLQEVNGILTREHALFSNIASRLSTDQMLAYIEAAADPAFLALGVPQDVSCDRELRHQLRFYLAGSWSLYANWLTADSPEPIEEVSRTIEASIMGAPHLPGAEDQRR